MGRLSGSVLALLLLCGACFGQNGLSRISGSVTDPSGAVIAGADVTARDEATGIVYNQRTTDAGLYSFPSLPLGPYSITVEAAGFKKYTRSGNVLEVSTPLAVNIALEVGASTDTVSVEASAEALAKAGGLPVASHGGADHGVVGGTPIRDVDRCVMIGRIRPCGIRTRRGTAPPK